jgi:hypothetical protein
LYHVRGSRSGPGMYTATPDYGCAHLALRSVANLTTISGWKPFRDLRYWMRLRGLDKV